MTLCVGPLGDVGTLISPDICGGLVHRLLVMIPGDWRKTLNDRVWRLSGQLFLFSNQVFQPRGWPMNITKIKSTICQFGMDLSFGFVEI